MINRQRYSRDDQWKNTNKMETFKFPPFVTLMSWIKVVFISSREKREHRRDCFDILP